MKQLPINISYDLQCLYCGHIETYIARSEHSNPDVEDEQLLKYFSTYNNTLDYCNHCKRTQVFKLNGYFEGK